MPQLKTNTEEQGFSLPDPYNDDIWPICQMKIYLNADADNQKAWKARSNVMNNNMNFSLCNIPLIREEAKYFSYYLMKKKKVSLRTFAGYADRFKILFQFVNQREYASVLDIDSDDFTEFISGSHKQIINDGSALISNEIVSVKRRNRILSFVDLMKKVISEYLEADRPLFERDVWLAKDLKNLFSDATRNLLFSDIKQPRMKREVKKYIKDRLSNVSVSTAASNLHDIKIFCDWLDKYDENIVSFRNITRDILEEYFTFLRVNSGFSQNKINMNILNLSLMFEHAITYSNPEFPGETLFVKDDWCFKTKRAAKFYTNEEIKAIFSLLRHLPKIYGRILLVLHRTGMRINEVLKLSINALKSTEGGKRYLSVYMYKTDKYNQIPIDDKIYELIKREIAYTKEKHPEAEYVFVDDEGKAINYFAFVKRIKSEIVKHNLRGSNGKLLEFKTHRFRATKATNLIDIGYEPQVVADMLGHRNLSSLTYYVAAKEQSLNEQMQEYLRKESILINSIGKMDENVIEDYKNAHPLCNGFCCRSAELGVCENLNACLTCSLFKPSLQHLTGYRLQLVEVESALATAKENGFKRMVKQCEKEKTALEKIIKGLGG